MPPAGDVLVPLTEAARRSAAASRTPLADLPPFGALQSAALADAFEQAQAILDTLADDAAWARLLRYRGIDLRPMAHKNLFFALEDVARVVTVARAASGARQRDNPARPRSGCGAGGEGSDAGCRNPARRSGPARCIAGADSPAGAIRARSHPGVAGRSPRAARRPPGDRVPRRATPRAPAGADTVAASRRSPDPLRGVGRAAGFPLAGRSAGAPGGVISLERVHVSRRGVADRAARARLVGAADLAAFGLERIGWLPPRLLWSLRYTDVQRYAAMIEAFEGLARAQRPALWITLEDLLAFGKCAAAAGERLGVPTLNVQHGIIGAYPYRTGIDVVGTFAAFGEPDRQTLIAQGDRRGSLDRPGAHDDIRALTVDRRCGAGQMISAAGGAVRLAARTFVTDGGGGRAPRAGTSGSETGAVVTAHPLEDVALRRLAADNCTRRSSRAVVRGCWRAM